MGNGFFRRLRAVINDRNHDTCNADGTWCAFSFPLLAQVPPLASESVEVDSMMGLCNHQLATHHNSRKTQQAGINLTQPFIAREKGHHGFPAFSF